MGRDPPAVPLSPQRLRSRAIRILLAMAVLTHALAGCCAHHRHAASADVDDACPPDDQRASVASRGDDHQGDCHHHPGRPEEGFPDDASRLAGRPTHPPHEACDGDPCRWVAPDASDSLADFVELPCNSLAIVVPSWVDGPLAGSQFQWRLSVATQRPLSVRAHLAKSVLLI